MKFELKIEFDQDDLNHLQDAFYEAFDRRYSNDEMMACIENMPNDLKLDIAKWSVFDTVILDAVYTWLKNEYQ